MTPSTMADPQDLLALAAKVEAATGPDRELDAAIAIALREPPEYAPWAIKFADWRVVTVQGFTRAEVWDGDNMIGHWHSFHARTASLDAAKTVVPEGWDWSASSYGEDGASAEVWVHGWQDDTRINSFLATTPSLCLIVAALRARAAIREGESA